MPGRNERGSRSQRVLRVLFLPLCALSVEVGGDGFPLVMLRSFLVPGALALLVLCGWFAWRKHWQASIGALLAALIALLPPFMVLQGAMPGAEGKPFIAVAQMNVHEANDAFAGAIAAARASGADVISFQEVDLRWHEALLDGLAPDYPWHIFAPGEKNYGIALFSRVPLEKAGAIDLGGLPAIRAVVKREGRGMAIISVHLRSPESAADLRQRNLQWLSLALLVKGSRLPACVVGDLNTVPWDGAFARFERSSGMGHGPHALAPTWPAVAGLALIPLDHVLISTGCFLAGSRTFIIPGSDHKGRSVRILPLR